MSTQDKIRVDILQDVSESHVLSRGYVNIIDPHIFATASRVDENED
jgi:hypothetical protein